MLLTTAALFLAILIGGDVPFPKHIEPVQYPTVARLAHWQGTVKARVELDPEGKVLRVKTEGRPPLADAVEASIKKWTFYIEKKNEIDMVIEFKFAGDPREFGSTTLITYDLPTNVTVVTQPPVCDHCPDKKR
jgi:TonB family protein